MVGRVQGAGEPVDVGHRSAARRVSGRPRHSRENSWVVLDAAAWLTQAAEQNTFCAVGWPYTSCVTNVQPVMSAGSSWLPGQLGLSQLICTTCSVSIGIGSHLLQLLDHLFEPEQVHLLAADDEVGVLEQLFELAHQFATRSIRNPDPPESAAPATIWRFPSPLGFNSKAPSVRSTPAAERYRLASIAEPKRSAAPLPLRSRSTPAPATK